MITCSVSGYGLGGPYGAKKAYDLLVQCEAGFLSVTGTEDDPAKAGISVADISAGMYAYTGILTALYKRERTGEGSRVDVGHARRPQRMDDAAALLHGLRRAPGRDEPGHAMPR